MAKNKNLSQPLIGEETKQAIVAIVCLVLTIFFILASLGFAGKVGLITYRGLSSFFGAGFFIIPLALSLLGVSFFRHNQPNFIAGRLISGLIFFLSLLGVIGVIFRDSDPSSLWNGGLIGGLIGRPLYHLFDLYSLIILFALMVISILIIFDTRLNLNFLRPSFWKRNGETDVKVSPLDSDSQGDTLTSVADSPGLSRERGSTSLKPQGDALTSDSDEGIFRRLMSSSRKGNKVFTPPPLSLLEKDSGKPSAGDIKANTNIIRRTLANFGIVVEMDEVSIGPSITRYALKPAEGVKLSKIVALQNDLSLALAAHPIRIEAPIPGKSLVGIEIPNSTKSIVGLGSLLGAREFAESTNPLLVALGRGISGLAHFANVAKAPHLLIAGATGSGKSVAIHTFIVSLLYRNPADQLRFIMIDPKRVELTLYNRIPHLLTPVVTDPKKAILVLKWAAKEMERRYNILESHAVRDIQSYHRNIVAAKVSPLDSNSQGDTLASENMPYIVIIIDELADMMSIYPRELEAAVVRLAQMSRAVGIHLVLSTQRPSVEVITGLIKANIPTRIALQVSSQIDSRTILDMGGAEKLLGAGDMLYLSGDRSKPSRLQSAYISEEEVKAVVDYLVKNYQDDLTDQIVLTNEKEGGASLSVDLNGETGLSDDDDLYEEAREIVIGAGKASASYLQRKLKVGYARAARLLDMLEERGVIGPGDGAKQREVYEKTNTNNEEAGF
jgi:S-DNA-T family DNA segregation ATPase FtsK/SpoIIIE